MTNRKTKLITIKVSEEEKAKWQQIANSNGLSLSDQVREKMNGIKIRRKKPMLEVDPCLLREINAIGNNLNQISRRLNGGERFDLLSYLVSIEQNLEELVNAYKISP